MLRDPNNTGQIELDEVLKQYPDIFVEEGAHTFGFRILRDPYGSEGKVLRVREYHSEETQSLIPLISYKVPAENRWEQILVTPEELIFKVFTMDKDYKSHEAVVEYDDGFRDLLEMSRGGLEILEAFYSKLQGESDDSQARITKEYGFRIGSTRKPVVDIETSLSFVQNTLNGINTFLEEERE